MAAIALVVVAGRAGAVESAAAMAADLGTIIDLDADPNVAADIADYVRLRLSDIDPDMDPTTIADYVVDVGRDDGIGVFLHARLLTDELRRQPVNTSADDWMAAVDSSLRDALTASSSIRSETGDVGPDARTDSPRIDGRPGL